jgi:hypothetical protein
VTNANAIEKKAEPAIETLRRLVRHCGWQNETFNCSFTVEELLKLYAFSETEQGKNVNEMWDTWPEWLVQAVLKYSPTLPPRLYERAKKIPC